MAILSKYERYYKDLSEIWSFAYDDQTRVHTAIMILQGCIIEMHSDLIQFELKNGRDKTKKAKDRLMVITDNLQILSKIQTDNFSLSIHNKNLIAQVNDLSGKLSEIERQEKEGNSL